MDLIRKTFLITPQHKIKFFLVFFFSRSLLHILCDARVYMPITQVNFGECTQVLFSICQGSLAIAAFKQRLVSLSHNVHHLWTTCFIHTPLHTLSGETFKGQWFSTLGFSIPGSSELNTKIVLDNICCWTSDFCEVYNIMLLRCQYLRTEAALAVPAMDSDADPTLDPKVRIKSPTFGCTYCIETDFV
jgi:hypothetical protein